MYSKLCINKTSSTGVFDSGLSNFHIYQQQLNAISDASGQNWFNLNLIFNLTLSAYRVCCDSTKKDIISRLLAHILNDNPNTYKLESSISKLNTLPSGQMHSSSAVGLAKS